jgi:hypothetical protein
MARNSWCRESVLRRFLRRPAPRTTLARCGGLCEDGPRQCVQASQGVPTAPASAVRVDSNARPRSPPVLRALPAGGTITPGSAPIRRRWMQSSSARPARMSPGRTWHRYWLISARKSPNAKVAGWRSFCSTNSASSTDRIPRREQTGEPWWRGRVGIAAQVEGKSMKTQAQEALAQRFAV